MKIGILFSGQGSQYPGMGESLYDVYPAAGKVFDEAGDDIKNWCFNGTKEELRQTYITQPCVYTVTMAAYAVFKEELAKLSAREGVVIDVDALAGFSMGEYAALSAASSISDFATGLSIISKRGEYMTAAGNDEDGNSRGGMIAVFGDRDKIIKAVSDVKEDNILEPVNFNSPVQTVVAGEKDAIQRLRAKIKETEGLKGVPLSVSTAFHSTMMKPAAENLNKFLEGREFNAPATKIYSNMTGHDIMENKPSDMSDSEWLRSCMAEQVMHPVYWQETIENMEKSGVSVMVEIGPGQVLTGLVKKTCPTVHAFNIQDEDSLKETMGAIEALIEEEIAKQ